MLTQLVIIAYQFIQLRAVSHVKPQQLIVTGINIFQLGVILELQRGQAVVAAILGRNVLSLRCYGIHQSIA